jgi:predicted phosphodiesterase
MRLQIVSDLHLEFWGDRQQFKFFKPSAPILVLAGDICCCGSDKDFAIFKRFIAEIITQYKHIIMVAGNHEYYADRSGATMEDINKKITAYFNEFNAVKNQRMAHLHFLNNNIVRMQQSNKVYIVIGSTLWSNIEPDKFAQAEAHMNDYSNIVTQAGKLRPPMVTAMHVRARAYITRQINAVIREIRELPKGSPLKYKIVIVTHHKPYESDKKTVLNFAYETNLTALFKPPVALWAYGHTHVADDSMHGTTRLYSNPKGYPGQPTRFNPSAFVKV